jgi:putative FmdB family regulatory protein
MPFYEYKCVECSAITEVLRPIKSRDDITACGRCGAATERVMSMSRFNTIGPITTQDPRENVNTDPGCKPKGTAVRLGGGSATFKDCSFQNFQTGISVAKGSKLSIDGSKFENVEKPIKVTDE